MSRQEIAAGRNVRLLCLIGAEARKVEGGAMSADMGFRVRHATSARGTSAAANYRHGFG